MKIISRKSIFEIHYPDREIRLIMKDDPLVWDKIRDAFQWWCLLKEVL